MIYRAAHADDSVFAVYSAQMDTVYGHVSQV